MMDPPQPAGYPRYPSYGWSSATTAGSSPPAATAPPPPPPPPAHAHPYGPQAPSQPSYRPYNMPSGSAGNKPWAGGGPVGTGVVPPDVEAQVLSSFANKAVRNGFQRKVFGLVAVQLAVTVAFAIVCLTVQPIKAYVASTPWPFYLSWGLSFGLLLVISCNERLRRTYPINMVLLGLFTVFQAFLVGMITSYFDIEAVMLAFLTTCVAVAVLALIACQSKVDVTSWGTLLLIPAAVLLALVLIGVFWINKVVMLVIAGVAALLACAYLVYDLQLIMGGKQYELSPDEYVFAAMSVYLDIVQIFIWTLALIGWSRQ